MFSSSVVSPLASLFTEPLATIGDIEHSADGAWWALQEGHSARSLCVSVCLILLWILEGEVFMSKLPIASGLIEILTFSQFPLSVCQPPCHLFPSLLLSPPCRTRFSFRCEQRSFLSGCQGDFLKMFYLSQFVAFWKTKIKAILVSAHKTGDRLRRVLLSVKSPSCNI